MHMKPAARSLLALFALIAIAAGAFAYFQTQTLRNTQADLAAAWENATAQAQALDGLITQAAGTRSAEALQSAEEIEGVRSAASTLQAGSVATRRALLANLGEARAQSTQDASGNATAAAITEATSTGQANALTDMQEAFDSISLVATQAAATASAQIEDFQQQAATAQADIAALSTQAAMAAQSPTEAPSVASGEARPSASINVGTVILNETFGEDSQFPAQTYAGSGETSFDNGQLLISVDDRPQQPITILAERNLADLWIEIEFTAESCAPNALVLLEVRSEADSTAGYAAGVNCSFASWGILKRIGQQVEVLASDALETIGAANAPHILGVEMRGSTLSLYLDGTLLGSATDTDYSDGAFGITLASANAAQVRFDNLLVWELDTETSNAEPEATIVAYDSRPIRDTFSASFPAEIEAENFRWTQTGDPEPGVTSAQGSSVSIFMQETDGVRAVVTVFFSNDAALLESTLMQAEQQLSIQPFEVQADDFPSGSLFGQSEDGFEALWTDAGSLIRLTIVDVEAASEAMLLALARAIRPVIDASPSTS